MSGFGEEVFCELDWLDLELNPPPKPFIYIYIYIIYMGS